jgi:hypothetical protein
MLRRWVETVRRRREHRLVDQQEAWLRDLHRFIDDCRSSLRPLSMPDDLVQSLHRLDWQLERIRIAERPLRRLLRRQAPGFDARVKEATGKAFHLRNLVTSFFIRWQTFKDAERSEGATMFMARREMEESLLNAHREARELAADVEEIEPALRLAIGLTVGRGDDRQGPRG